MNDHDKTTDVNSVVKILAELMVEDKELFLKFIRRLAMSSEETQDMTGPVVSSLPEEKHIS